MIYAIEKLIKILSLEEKTGYADKSVIGGLERFAPHWRDEALAGAPSEAARVLVERVVKGLESYPTCETDEQRRVIVSGLQEQLKAALAADLAAREPALPQATRPALTKPVAQPLIGHTFSPASTQPAAPAEPAQPSFPALHKPACHTMAEAPEEARVEPRRQPEADDPPEPAPSAPVGGASHVEERAETAVEQPAAGQQASWDETRSGYAVFSSDDMGSEEQAEGEGGAAGQPAPALSKPNTQPAVSPSPTHRGGYGLDADITCLPSVGEAQAKRLGKLGIQTINDLLYLFPRRYDDYSRLKSIRQLQIGEEVTVIANVGKTNVRQMGPNRSILKASLSDGTGTLEITWFNQPFLAGRLQAAGQIVVSGRVEQYLGRPTMTAPEWEPLDKELIHTGRLVPVYPLTEGVSNRWLRRLIKRAVDYWAERIEDYVPDQTRARSHLPPLGWALAEIHFPASAETLQDARRRLTFDEFLLLQLGVLRQRQVWRSQTGRALQVDREALSQFLGSLPYALTGAQERALAGILGDLAQPTPMNRLLQGDVGSGKTVVALAAALCAIQNGFQVAVMAPTEILAEQHAKSMAALLGPVSVPGAGGTRPIAVRLLTGSMKPAERQEVCTALAAGSVDLVVGTHALIQEGVQFERLALVIVDEQHRFGVKQRAALRQKGYNPHLLVMTATPIPRTLSLTLFGDLDLSVIDELPPGRQPIETYLVTSRERERAYQFVRKQVADGHQAFVICPLIEESDKIEAKAAVDEYERLKAQVFPDLRLGLLHGRMKGEEKEDVMRRFVAGDLDVLVSTAVVEVGINVPNATVMLIEGADRFGLAQLHQFRGRVGRGPAPSYCLLVSDSTTEEGMARLRAIAESQDGFALAEIDLKMRGPGEFFGTRQSGLPDLRLAELADVRQLEQARAEAEAILAEDAGLSRPEHAACVPTSISYGRVPAT